MLTKALWPQPGSDPIAIDPALLELVRESDVGTIVTDVRDKEIGAHIRDQGRYAPGESEFLRGVLRPGMCVIDVGAHIGWFTRLIARKVGPTGAVLAIEPHPHNYALLHANTRDVPWVEILPIAADREDGYVEMTFDVANQGGAHAIPGQGTTPAYPIDAILKSGQRVDFVKIDVEGMEQRVVAGLEQTIRCSCPTMLVEFCPVAIERVGDDPAAVLAGYRDLGYDIYLLGSDAVLLADHRELDLRQWASRDLRVIDDHTLIAWARSILLINLVLRD